jgi:protein-S-isoprenylcysteine O-methyltransferase Ste14
MYTGITISQIGIGLFSMNLWMIFACFFFTLSFMVRVPREEQLLSEYFKEEFVLYQEETGMFIPRLLRHR